MSKSKTQHTSGAEKVTAPSRSPKSPNLNTNPEAVNATRKHLKRAAASRYAENVARRQG
jgi:hypothetical protein